MIIVNQSPTDGQSLHYPLWHVVNCDIVNNTSTRCIFDIYIDSVLVTRHKIFPPPSIGTNAYFDASPIIRTYVEKYFNPTNTFLSFSTNDIYVEYTVKYGEEYTTSGGTVVTNLNLATTTHKVYNCYTNHLQGGSLVVMGSGHTFLSDRDTSNIWFAPSYSFFLPYLKPTVANHFFFFYGKDASGSTVGGYSQPSVATANLGKLAQLRLSSSIMNTLSAGSFTSAVEFVDVEFGNGTALQNFIIRTKVWCNPKHEPVVLTFLNRYGGYESVVFGLVNRLEVEYERQSYQQSGWSKSTTPSIIPAPDPSVYVGAVVNHNTTTKVYNHTDTPFNIRHKYSYKLISDFQTETNYNWLKQLIASPIIYMESGGYFYPVTINKDFTRWTQKKEGADKMFNLELTIDSFNNIFSNG